MENNDPFKLLLLIALLFVFVFVPFVCDTPIKAAYSNSGSVSTSQTLTLVILPALEHAPISAQRTDTDSTSYVVGLRANTAWGIDYNVSSTGETPRCQISGNTGQRNLNENFQFVQIDCVQPWSWADTDIEQTLTYTITPKLGDA